MKEMQQMWVQETQEMRVQSPDEGNGNPLQYSCLKSSMERGAWWATVRAISKSQTWLNMHACIQKKKKNLNHRREIAITELCESFKMNHWIRVYLSYQHTLLPFDYLTHELFIGWGLLICSLSEILTDFLSPNFCYFHLPSGL